MAVSAADTLTQIPGFRDRLGERLIVPQQSGALLEFLHFCDQLADAPFFTPALKERITQLGNFRHSSYCRVRRLQSVGDGRPALVSGHLAGRRLAEVLDVAARSDLRPSTAGVLAVTRQLMASVALLHDFAPYGFHAALGPDRLILAGEGRVVVSEHVLGTAIEEAVQSWGVKRLWHEFRIPALPEPKSPQYGRRVDVVQIGLVTLSMLLGRQLGDREYPEGLPQLLAEVEETTAEGTRTALRSPLRGWLERALGLRPESSFRTLLEAQKAFGQLLQDDHLHASSVAWDAFVGVCETAALRVPVLTVAAGPEPRAPIDSQDGVPVSVAPELVAPEPAAPEPAAPEPAAPTLVEATPVSPDAFAGFPPAPDHEGPLPALEVTFPEPVDPEAVAAAADPAAVLREDPFEPWPAASPGATAALLDRFDAPPASPMGAAALAAVSSEPAPPRPDQWEAAPATHPSAPRPETLFEAPKRPATEAVPTTPPAQPLPPAPWDEPKTQTQTSVADWNARDRAQDLSYLVLNERPETGEAAAGQADEPVEPFDELDGSDRKARRIRLAVIIAVGLLGVAATAFAPYAWKVVFEGRFVQGTLRVESEPPGAIISVDGQVLGHTPADLPLKAGEHQLDVQLGGSAISRKVTIAKSATEVQKLRFPEAGERGGLMISTYPLKGKVTVDGVTRGEAPLKVTDLQPGTHTLLVETSLGAQEQDVVVQPGRVSQLSVPTVSWIKVNSSVELSVYDNGRLLGNAASGAVQVAPGRRNLDFVNRSLGLKVRQYVDAVAGQVITVPIDLPTGMMNLYADQTAEVLVDGTVVGQTPLPGLQVPLGSHEVVFRHPKFNELRYTVMVTLTSPVKLNVVFRK